MGLLYAAHEPTWSSGTFHHWHVLLYLVQWSWGCSLGKWAQLHWRNELMVVSWLFDCGWSGILSLWMAVAVRLSGSKVALIASLLFDELDALS